MASEGGCGKSLLSLHLGISLVTNRETSLRSKIGTTLTPNRVTGKVALLYAEEDENTCLFRLQQMLKRIQEPGLKPSEYERVELSDSLLEELNGKLFPLPLQISNRGADSNISLSDSTRGEKTGAQNRFERLYESLEHHGGGEGWDMIVVDPLAQFGSGDFEVDNGEASRLMRQFQQLTSLPGNPAVLLIHHSSKSSKKGKLAHAVRGSSALKDNARWVGILRRIDETETGEDYLKDKDGRGVVELIIAKSNYGPSFKQARFICHNSSIIKIQDNDLLTAVTLNHVKVKKPVHGGGNNDWS